MRIGETAEMMVSEDYKERFKAEYYQLKERFYKLDNMLTKWDKGELDFEPTCPRELYNAQSWGMAQYKAALETRALLEGIYLNTDRNG